MARLSTTVLAVLALVAASAWYFYDQKPASFSVEPVAEVSGIIKSINSASGTESRSQTALVELPGGTQVEAAVPGSCAVIVGQTALLSVFQPTKLAPKVYVVVSAASK